VRARSHVHLNVHGLRVLPADFLSPRLNDFVHHGLCAGSENPFGGLRAFQNGFARKRSDADAITHKKGARPHADASDEANADR